jgi:hypothetical protein
MSTPGRKAEALAFWGLLVITLALFAWRWSGQASGMSADQAESLVLARSLVEGFGLRLTAWSSSSPGPANLPWLAVQALVLELGAVPELWLPRISLVLMGLALVVVALRSGWVWRRAVQLEDVLPALGLGLATSAAETAALGSGSSAWVLALAVVAILMGRGLSTGSSTVPAIAIGALCLFRPSAIWLVLASTPAWWVAARMEGRPALREALRFLAGGLLVAGVVFAFRFGVLGSLPLEGLLPSEEGRVSTAEFLVRQSRWFWAALAGGLVAAVWRRFHLRGGGTVVAWVLMTVVLANWTDTARSLFLGCVPLLAMLVGDGLSASREGMFGPPQVFRSLSRAAFVGLTVMLGLAAASSFALGPIMQVRQAVAPRPEMNEELVRRGLRQPLVVWTDAAEAAALFPSARVVVATTPTLALEDLLVSEGPPDVVDLRLNVEALPRLAASMAPGPSAWWLAEQSPDDDPRCPEGRLALLSTSPEQLLAQLEKDVAEEQLQRGLSRWRCALAALEAGQLPDATARRSTAGVVAGRSAVFEQQGRLELALRAASLAASLDGEEVQRRARAERLRVRWLASR